MARDDWVFDADRRSAAAERIYASATDLVLVDGFDALNIDALAARLHCSRATVYRYAGGKAHLRDAVLARLAEGIVDDVRLGVRGLTGPERVVTAMTVALARIRADPLRRILFTAGRTPNPDDLLESPVLSAIATELTGIADDPHSGQWIVRVVVSLAFWPLADARDEELVLRRFVAPAFDA